MSAPLVPSPLDYIGRRRFGFYPPIRHAQPNVWMLGAGSWGEVQVVNASTGAELWIPRQYVGAVSDNQDALTVGLTQFLELSGGKVVPRSRQRVIQMQRRDNAGRDERKGPAKIVGIRLESNPHSTFQKAPFRVGIFVLFVMGLLALVASASR